MKRVILMFVVVLLLCFVVCSLVYTASYGFPLSQKDIVNWEFVNGKNWINTYDIYSLAINPKNPNIVYAGTKTHGVYMSKDNGLNWNAANVGLLKYKNGSCVAVHSLAINPKNPNIVYAGTESGIFRCTENAKVWNELSSEVLQSFNYKNNLEITSLAIDKTSGYIGVYNIGIFKMKHEFILFAILARFIIWIKVYIWFFTLLPIILFFIVLPFKYEQFLFFLRSRVRFK